MLVWKLKENNGLIDIQSKDYNARVADLSLFSFIKVIAKINKFKNILAYRNDPGLNERMPGYKVNMGFGLH